MGRGGGGDVLRRVGVGGTNGDQDCPGAKSQVRVEVTSSLGPPFMSTSPRPDTGFSSSLFVQITGACFWVVNVKPAPLTSELKTSLFLFQRCRWHFNLHHTKFIDNFGKLTS